MLPPEGEPMGIEDIRDALVIRERSTFLLTDPHGNVPAGNTQGFGIYHADTRHLSTYNFTLNGVGRRYCSSPRQSWATRWSR